MYSAEYKFIKYLVFEFYNFSALIINPDLFCFLKLIEIIYDKTLLMSRSAANEHCTSKINIFLVDKCTLQKFYSYVLAKYI